MKKRFTEQQIAFALRQAASGTSVAEIIFAFFTHPNALTVGRQLFLFYMC